MAKHPLASWASLPGALRLISIAATAHASAVNLFLGDDKVSRIIGGGRAPSDRFPYAVPLHVDGSHFCGGFLIAPNAVLTAAHCMDGEKMSDVTVFVGSDNVEGGTEYDIADGYEHPDYDADTDEYDMYVIILDGEVTGISPVLLNADGAYPTSGMMSTVMGWGEDKRGDSPEELHSVELEVLSNAQCKAYDDDYNDWVYPDMICTLTPGKDSCYGDSGGPVVIEDPDSDPAKDVAFGIVSWGVGCAGPPGVYARVSAGIDWIVDRVCDDHDGTGPLCGTPEPTPPPTPHPTPPPGSPTNPPTAGAITAAYDSGLGAPACSSAARSCDSGDLLEGTGANVESNAPNTLDGCDDGDGDADYLDDESVESILVSAVGGRIEKGGAVEIRATVHAWSTGSADEADFYWATDASNPSWEYLGTLSPGGGGIRELTMQHDIPTGGSNLQAVRVNFRYGGSTPGDACSGGSDGGDFDDTDDMVVYVADATTPSPTAASTPPPTPPPNRVLGTDSPTSSPTPLPTPTPPPLEATDRGFDLSDDPSFATRLVGSVIGRHQTLYMRISCPGPNTVAPGYSGVRVDWNDLKRAQWELKLDGRIRIGKAGLTSMGDGHYVAQVDLADVPLGSYEVKLKIVDNDGNKLQFNDGSSPEASVIEVVDAFSSSPTGSPIKEPSASPTPLPTNQPTAMPSKAPTAAPTTAEPTPAVTPNPTAAPSTAEPTPAVTPNPTAAPSVRPTSAPSTSPTSSPTPPPSPPTPACSLPAEGPFLIVTTDGGCADSRELAVDPWQVNLSDTLTIVLRDDNVDLNRIRKLEAEFKVEGDKNRKTKFKIEVEKTDGFDTFEDFFLRADPSLPYAVEEDGVVYVKFEIDVNDIGGIGGNANGDDNDPVQVGEEIEWKFKVSDWDGETAEYKDEPPIQVVAP